MKSFLKFSKYILISFSLILFSSSFISPNTSEIPSHLEDEKYSSFANSYDLYKYDDEENMIPPNIFSLTTGEINFNSNKPIILTENQVYTFVFYIKDKTRLNECNLKENNYLTYTYQTPGVAEFKIDRITYNLNNSSPKQFLNSSTISTPTLNEPVFKLSEDCSYFFLSIYTQNIYSKYFRIPSFNLIFNKTNSCGIISNYQLYKGDIASFKGYKEFNHAPFGLSKDFIGPYKDKTEINMSIPYKDDQINANDIKNSLLAFDKGDYEYKEVEIVSDAFSSSFRVLNTKLPIIFQATDSLNNKSTITFNMTIYDDIPPTITQLNSQIEISYKSNLTKQEILSNFKIEDNYTLNVSTQIEGYDFDSELKLGKHNITIKASDTSNNISKLETSFKIVDDIPPQIKGPTFINTNINTYLSKEDILANFTPFDEIDSNLEIEIIEDNYSNNFNQAGEYLICLECKDYSSNKIRKSVIINVSDNSGPVFYLNQTNLTMYQGDSFKVNDIVKSLVRNQILLEKNYTNIELISLDIKENKALVKGEFDLTLKCFSDDNQISFIQLKLNVKEKETSNSTTPFSNFINKITDFFKKIFDKFNL